MDKPLLSVIIPVYGVEDYLPQCLDSVLSQTYENLEILLMDDGSRDGCPAICDAYAEKDSRITVIHRENGGQAQARNQALDLCRGDYITFVDGDDWIEPNTYEEMLSAIQKNGADLAVCGRFDVDEETGNKQVGLCPEREEVLDPDQMLIRMFTWQGCDCSPCDKVFKKQLFEGIRFPLKSGSEDIAILYKLVLAGEKTVLVPKPFYNYLQRSHSTSYGAVNEKTFQYEQYTRALYEEVCARAPQAKAAAGFLRVRSISRPVLLLDLSDGMTRKTYETRLKNLRKALRSHLGFILSCSYFSRQEQATDLLLGLNCYRFFRKLLHRQG